MATFESLWNNYPTEPREALFNDLGGGWPALIPDTKNYGNTCTIRFSVALNRSGFKVPSSLSDGGHKDKNGNSIAIRVSTGEALAKNFFGESYWGMSHNPGDSIDLKDVPNTNGLLIYRVKAGDANGHVDLWKEGQCRIDCHSTFANYCFEIALWRLP